MKIKVSILLVIISFVLFNACQTKDPILEEISILIDKSESSLKLLDDVKTKKIENYKEDAKTQLKALKPYIEEMEQDFLQKYSTVANTVKLMKKQPFNKDELTKEINFNTTQLKALYTAQKNKTMNSDKIQELIKKEKNALTKTKKKINNITNTYQHIIDNFNAFIPAIKNYQDSLTQHQP